MLLTTFMFDSSNPSWSKSNEYNYKFLRETEKYFNDVLKMRGYIYLNQIYEALHMEWNVKDDNLCVARDDGTKLIKLELLGRNDGTIVVHIYCYR